MPVINLRKGQISTVISSATADTATPSGTSNIVIPKNHELTTFIESTGSLVGTIKLWVNDSGSNWYAGDTFAYTGGKVAVAWNIPPRRCWFQLIGSSGSGTITVKVL